MEISKERKRKVSWTRGSDDGQRTQSNDHSKKNPNTLFSWKDVTSINKHLNQRRSFFGYEKILH